MQNKTKILIWLLSSAILVVAMIFLGGLTRLSEAGLSITEWNPISGIIPPLTETSWNLEFEKYKLSIEFQQIHSHFSLADFKYIFWFEFLHRVLGRITGLCVIIPYLWFLYKKILPLKFSYISMLLLVCVQGVVGWWMVKSGLSNMPHVSHFRLATHLMIAIALYSVIFWQILKILGIKSLSIKNYSAIFVTILVGMQILLGALVAGLDAGMVYNTFPMMGLKFVPTEFVMSFGSFSDPVSVQFMHRIMAYILFFVMILFSYNIYHLFPKFAILIVIILLFQIILGILTLIYIVPIKLALIHQLCAILLWSLMLYISFVMNNYSNDHENIETINGK